jgi:hypothetical protein
VRHAPIFIAGKTKFAEFLNSKNAICNKMHKFKFYFGLTYKELGKFFFACDITTKNWNLTHFKSKKEGF